MKAKGGGLRGEGKKAKRVTSQRRRNAKLGARDKTAPDKALLARFQVKPDQSDGRGGAYYSFTPGQMLPPEVRDAARIELARLSIGSKAVTRGRAKGVCLM